MSKNIFLEKNIFYKFSSESITFPIKKYFVRFPNTNYKKLTDKLIKTNSFNISKLYKKNNHMKISKETLNIKEIYFKLLNTKDSPNMNSNCKCNYKTNFDFVCKCNLCNNAFEIKRAKYILDNNFYYFRKIKENIDYKFYDYLIHIGEYLNISLNSVNHFLEKFHINNLNLFYKDDIIHFINKDKYFTQININNENQTIYKIGSEEYKIDDDNLIIKNNKENCFIYDKIRNNQNEIELIQDYILIENDENFSLNEYLINTYEIVNWDSE